MMYQKGDLVRVRDDLQVGSVYGPTPIRMTYDMKECCGLVLEITDTDEKEGAVKAGGWWWSETMVLPAVGEKAQAIADGARSQVEALTRIIGAFRGFDLEKRLEEQLAVYLYEHGTRVMEWKDPQDKPQVFETVLLCVSGRPSENIRMERAVGVGSYLGDDEWMFDEFPFWQDVTVHGWTELPGGPVAGSVEEAKT